MAGDTEQLCDLTGVEPIAHDLSPPCSCQHLRRRATTEPYRLLIIELPQERGLGSHCLNERVSYCGRNRERDIIVAAQAKLTHCLFENRFRGMPETRFELHGEGFKQAVMVGGLDLAMNQLVADHPQRSLSDAVVGDTVRRSPRHKNSAYPFVVLRLTQNDVTATRVGTTCQQLT